MPKALYRFGRQASCQHPQLAPGKSVFHPWLLTRVFRVFCGSIAALTAEGSQRWHKIRFIGVDPRLKNFYGKLARLIGGLSDVVS